jgi:cationic amino acid transporter 1
LVGWSLILEYTIGASAVARGITPNLVGYILQFNKHNMLNNFVLYLFCSFLLQALFFGGQDNLPSFLARHTLPGLGIVVDPCAAVLIILITFLLCLGIKEVCIFK